MTRKISLIVFLSTFYFCASSQTINNMARTPQESGIYSTKNIRNDDTVTFETFNNSNFPPIHWSMPVSSKWDTASYETQYKRYARCKYIANYNFNDLLITPSVNYSLKTVDSTINIGFRWRGSKYWSITEDSCDLKLLFSIDGGTNWDTIWTEETNPQWENWVWNTTLLNISDKVAGKSNVKFAFLYKGLNGAEFDIDEIKTYPSIYNVKLKGNEQPLYAQYPVKQAANIAIGAIVQNTGLREVTNIVLSSRINSTSTTYDHTSTSTIASLPFNNSRDITNNFQTIIRGVFEVNQTITTTEGLGNIRDDAPAYQSFIVSDTVYARDNGTALGSLGEKTDSLKVVGQIFHIVNSDTLNSVSVYLNNPLKNDSLQIAIYTTVLDTIYKPDTIYHLSSMIVADTSQSKWYNISMNGLYLPVGIYYVAVMKKDTANIPVGTSDNFATNTVFVNKNNFWKKAENIGKNVSLMLRLNTRYDAQYVANGSSTNIEENYKQNKVLLFPNPANDKFTLICKSNIEELSIYDFSGRLILKTCPFQETSTISTNELVSGIYFIQIKTVQGIYNEKLIISK